MIQNRKLDHLGLLTKDLEKTTDWYCRELGFRVIGKFLSPSGASVWFIKNDAGIVYELIQPKNPDNSVFDGKIEHVSYVSEDIEADYRFCAERGYIFDTDGVQELPTFWENGARSFKFRSGTGEIIEFCQKL